jgi:hypothetical protein
MADSMALPEGPIYAQEIVWRPKKLLDCDFAARRAKSFRAYERHNDRDIGGVFLGCKHRGTMQGREMNHLDLRRNGNQPYTKDVEKRE